MTYIEEAFGRVDEMKGGRKKGRKEGRKAVPGATVLRPIREAAARWGGACNCGGRQCLRYTLAVS